MIQQALGGHAIPVDDPARRALERLGIAERRGRPRRPSASLLERAVPKNRGVEFVDLIEELAHDTCVEGEPDCPRCELRKICPTGLARKEEAHVAAKQAAAQARAAAKVSKAKEPPKTHTKAAPAPTPPPRPPAKAASKPSKAAPKRRGGGK